MRMLFISNGNIPSPWAHTVQMMKMAEAFSRIVPNFRILTQAHWSRLFRPRFDYRRYYGLSRRVRVAHVYARNHPHGPIVECVSPTGFYDRAAEYARRGKFDLVFTRAPQAAERCISDGMPCILEMHSTTDERKMLALENIRRDAKLLGVVTISDVVREQLQDAGVPDSKICVWPDAVDLRAFTSLPSRDSLRKNLGLPRNEVLATYCGHLYEHRGIEEILESAAALPQVRFLFVGGWEKDVAARRAESAHLPNVTFTGFVANRLVPAYLTASDVLLMPYSPDCKTAEQMSPMKMFEYMAAERPIVATDLPALRRHLRHKSNSLLIPPHDGAALARAIRRLIDTPEVANRFAHQARKDVRPYAWDRRATQILDQFVFHRSAAPSIETAGAPPAARQAA
ncbi:MAG: glycosyltransferase family 4 protein [Planctomycetales bacterium]|nr:glycosyltransferase family 4 protein [Planctomycetales bacterium]